MKWSMTKVNYDETYIVGVSMTKFGVYPDRSVKDMVRESVFGCLKDAGATIADVEAIFFANVGQSVVEGQVAVPGQIALRPLGFQGVPITNVENGCASATTAMWLAVTQVRAGMADCVLAVGVEKLSAEDPSRRDAIFAGGFDVHNREGVFRDLKKYAEGTEAPPVEGDRSIFMDIYGYWTRAHMRDFGTTQEQLAMIASKNHWHSTMNPLSYFQKPFTLDEVLAARPLSYPLTVPMCAAYSDGAAAALICSAAAVRRLKAEAIAVPIKSLALRSGEDRPYGDWERHITTLTATQAYEEAGVGPDEIDVAEVHDATAFGELLNSENLGFAPRGEGGSVAVRGETKLGGRIPINVSGGLESRGHPLGATGLAQVYELVTQLRGRAGKRQVEGARLAVVENGGGLYGIEEACAVVGVFSAPGV
jgi:acetyl-CoA acetyltransferase